MFTREKQVWLQVAALFFQIVSPTIPVIPDEWRPMFIALVSFIQAALAIFGQSKNPDGTPAEMPYQPAAKMMPPVVMPPVIVTAEPVVPPVVEPVAKESK